jgi:hypothetical protein
MRLLTYYTPSHADMCRRFVLSRAWAFSEVRAIEYQQTCPTGAFKQPGWNRCMDDKLDALLRLPVDGEPTLYVDSDVILWPGACQWAENHIRGMSFDEIAYSDDVVQWCAGVMLFRPTTKTRRWWELVADMSRLLDQPDQDVIHALRTNAKSLPVPMSVMPSDKVANWATLGNTSVWQGESIAVPKACYIWHANWCVGVEAKMQMLEQVALSGKPQGVPVSSLD